MREEIQRYNPLLIRLILKMKGDIYEAEDAAVIEGCKESTRHSGFRGKGYIDYGSKESYIEWNNVQAEENGQYTLSFRYATSSKARPCTLYINNF